MRVFAISDVHTDYRENLQLLAGVSRYRDDALILAGDVSHDLEVLRQTLGLLLERFRYVFFVPGNHELWVRKGEYEDSLQKFHAILRLCASLGVRTEPECVGAGQDRVCIVPLFSWYTRPEEGSDSLFRDRPLEEPATTMWTDDYLVKWPAQLRPAQFFRDLNDARASAAHEVSCISFSHFMPRSDLMFATAEETPPLRPDPHAPHFNFSRVAGSTLIEEQIRKLDSRVHVYGHQHRNRHRRYEGIWYVSNCLGYRDERDRRSVLNPATIVRPVWPLQEAFPPKNG
jgi:predicted phosphodiesterase